MRSEEYARVAERYVKLIPEAALAQHMAFLGKTGSGKTSTAKLAVEQIVRNDPGARVCVLDPIKSDWWGLTSSADGKSPGLPFHILGGPRGHVPLHDSAGKAIGELVGTGALPLSIIDMADFAPGGQSRFFNDFAPALMKKIRGVVYLVIEEAHEFAPKERSGIGAENMAIHWAKKLATAGRSKGIRMMVLTQRTQALHNALLGSCDTMVAHRLTAPADQEPVKKWLKANVDKAIFEKVSTSLSSLKTGSGWICSGEAQVAGLVQFPKISTYDNSATPTGDGDAHEVKTAPADHDRLRAIIGTAVQEAEANDPKLLKARVLELERQLRTVPAPAAAATDPRLIDEAERLGYARAAAEISESARTALNAARSNLVGLRGPMEEAIAFLSTQIEMARIKSIVVDTVRRPCAVSAPPAPPRGVNRAEAAAPAIAGKKIVSAEASGLTNPQLTLLRSIAWWRAMGHSEPTRPQIAAIAGWKPSGSNLKDRLSELSKLGLVEYPRTGFVRFTPAGIAAAPAPDMSQSLIDSIRSILTGPQLKLFDALLEFGREVTREELADCVGWERGGSNLKDRLSELSRLEVVTYPQRGVVALHEWVRSA